MKNISNKNIDITKMEEVKQFTKHDFMSRNATNTIRTFFKRSYSDCHSHTTMCMPLGKWELSRKKFDPFFEKYQELVKNEEFVSITEKPQDYSMLVVDIDHKEKGTEPKSLYDMTEVETVVKA